MLNWIIIIAFLPTTRAGGWEMGGGIRNSRQARAAMFKTKELVHDADALHYTYRCNFSLTSKGLD